MTTMQDLMGLATKPDAGDLDSYALPYLDMLVVLEDGRRLQSHADQRDMRRGQIAVGTDPSDDPIGFNRAVAWAYLTRTGELEQGWKDFDAVCLFVIPLEVQTAADPTRTATDS